MRHLVSSLAGCVLVLAVVRPGLAQPQAAEAALPGVSLWRPLPPPPPDLAAPGPEQPTPAPEATTAATAVALDMDAAHFVAEIEGLRKEQAALQAQTQDEDVKKKIEILEKQIQTLEDLVKLLAKKLEKQPPLDQIQAQAATLEARSVQAARRDVELANAIDDIREHMDALARYGPDLPAPVHELFLLSGNSETPLSIYGALAVGYSHIIGNAATAANGAGRPSTPGGFYFGEFTPDFLLKLNDWIFLEAEVSATQSGGSLGSFAQADFFVNDWLTIIAGRFVAPIGWFNERLNNPWINKLPADAPGSGPLLWEQVLPPFSLLGIQATGAFYLGCTPIKMEYSAYVSNGLNFTPGTSAAPAPSINELANLENMENTLNIITNEKAIGGRVGFWWPEKGLEVGFSAMYNGDYIAGGFENSISLWALDFNFHKHNWDVRAEYGMLYQQAMPFLPTDITRQGFHGQIAYRPKSSHNCFLQNVEVVYRYGYVNFTGIDATTLDLTTFSTPVDVPTRRQQNEFGVNYYFYPRMVLKCAYQINDEPGFHLHDNQFLAELAWGW
jgi:hypothetical protein